MGLFGDKKQPLPDLLTESELNEVATFKSSLNFLTGLSDAEYEKVMQVAVIHRRAYKESAEVLGIKNFEPRTYIEPQADLAAPDFLDMARPEPSRKTDGGTVIRPTVKSL